MNINKVLKLNYLKDFLCYFKKHNKLKTMVIQDIITKDLLMIGFSDIESIDISLESGYVIFYSRTKYSLWVKGETSGNILEAYSLYLDCDKDSILIYSLLKGTICHLGNYSCFYSGRSSLS